MPSWARIEMLCPRRSHPCRQETRPVTINSAPASTSPGKTSTAHLRRPCVLTAFAMASISGRWLLGRVRPGDVTVDRGSADAMLPAAAAGLAPGVEAADDLAVSVHDLRLSVDPQAAVGILHPNGG